MDKLMFSSVYYKFALWAVNLTLGSKREMQSKEFMINCFCKKAWWHTYKVFGESYLK